MESKIIEAVAKAAGIGGIALGVLLLLFREFIRKNIFPNLTRRQSYNILRLFLVLIFAVALAGIGAWIRVQQTAAQPAASAEPPPPDDAFRRVYYEGFSTAPADGGSAAIWLTGHRDDWTGSYPNGSHRLCNSAQNASASFTNRLTYHVPGQAPASLGDAKVSVRVRIEPPSATHSGAGLRYRAAADRVDYLAFLVNAGNSVSLLRRSPTGLGILWSGEIPQPAAPGWVTLKIVGNGPELDLYVDDRLVHRALNVDLLTGEPGIMAYSLGCFGFDDFALYVPTP